MENKTPSILLIENQEINQQLLFKKLEQTYDLFIAKTAIEAEQMLDKHTIDLAIIDIDYARIETLKLVKKAKEKDKETKVIIISKLKEIKTVVKVIKLGAIDYIEKPYDIDRLSRKIDRIIDREKNGNGIEVIKETYGKHIFQNMVGKDRNIKKVFELINTVSQSDGTVLIQGESGTGKGLAARAIHRRSHRKNGPFVVVNCAAIPVSLMERELFGHTRGAFTGANISSLGKLEIANNGTVFLDDIDSLDIHMQAKLLRIIQEKEFERLGSTKVIHLNVRFLAATNKNLKQMISDGDFREDLFYRLNVFPLTMPPLRDRKTDIKTLLMYFLNQHVKSTGKPNKYFSENAIKAMEEYNWPGNVREMQNLVERLFTTTSGYIIRFKDVSSCIDKNKKDAEITLKDKLAEIEKEHILKALKQNNGNRKKTAKKLGIHRNTLLNKLNEFGLK